MGGVVSRWKARKTEPTSDEEGKQDEDVVASPLGFAWVTLATNDSYSLGALVLAHSLRNVNTAHKLAVLITPGVSPPMKEQLSTVFDVVKVVDVLDSKDEAHLALMKRPELGVTFTKIHCWRLTEFEKCVFLDADTLVLRHCDELFEREELSAAPDVGWPDCFNTGVFVFKPSIETFDNLIQFSLENGSFDGGDQGLLNQFFGDWATKDINKHLPFVYNLTSVAVYSYIPAFKQYGTQVRIVHFIGNEKPWLQQLDPQTRSVNTNPGAEHLAPMLQIWWNIFCDKVHPSMTSNLECDSGMMRNDEMEAFVNEAPNEPEPENIQPFAPYVDKDDSRQINLPYQPFDVRSSSGELLNRTYLEKREQEIMEEEGKAEEVKEETRDEVGEEWKPDDGDRKPEVAETEVVGTEPVVEEVQPPREDSLEEQQSVVEPSPFNYETFFPDETCVQIYLQQNVMTYQPLENHEKKQYIPQVPGEEHHLPRFLTIAEDDKRQSLNVCCREEPKPSQSEPCHYPSENQNQAVTTPNEDRQVPEASPELDVPNVTSSPGKDISFWESHPSLNNTNRRYSMPKLKPILPKQSPPQVFVSDVRPKITQYTEFHMSCEYPEAIPCDKLGFVERHILEEVAQRIPSPVYKLKTLSFIFPLEAAGRKESITEPPKTGDIREDVDYDLSSCQRQKGNQPLQTVPYKRGNSCFLPVLKPIRPSKSDETKRKLKAMKRPSKERGTKAKIESRKAREKAKAETSIKPIGEPTSVEDILKKLISFSKDYHVYFTGDVPVKKKEKENLVGAAFKNLYPASTKDSPRIQYSKEFEEPTDVILSPLVNGHSHNQEEVTERTTNGHVEEPIPKTAATSLCNISIDMALVQLEVPKPAANGLERLTNGNEPNGNTSRSESPKPKTVVADRNGMRSPGESAPTYASVVKQGEKTFRSDVVVSNATQPKKKLAAKTSRPSRAARKEKKDYPRVPNQRIPTPLPAVKDPETVAKPANPFTLLPEEAPGEVTLKPRRNPKSVTSLPTRRPPARKANQDRRVVESLVTVDDAHVDNSGIAGAIAKLSIQPGGLPGTPSGVASSAQEDYVRRQNWEMGTMDYMGRDSFDNIWSKICETIDGKVTKDLDQGGASGTPTTEAAIPQKDEKIAPQEKSQGQPQQESPETMIAQGDVVPPIESDASTGTSKIADELAAKATDIASKATEALEAFGKLFVSGPVAIKSEVAEEATPEKKEEPKAEDAIPTERKKSTEDEEGKQKKGVINKILELVGVGKPETSTAVFYDTEQPQGDQPKEDKGKSVFYDTETPPTGVEEPKLSAGEATKGRESSPSLTLKTAPGMEVVCPTPPSTPMTPLPGLKDGMLSVDDTIKATPPVTDKKFDDLPKPADKDAIKSEVDKIIDVAKKIAEDQLQEPKKETQSPAPSTSMALVPRVNDALEVFGKLFVSGPVTIKSEVPEETPRPAIPMHDVPGRTAEPTAPIPPAAAESVPPAAEAPAGIEKPVVPKPADQAASASEQVTPLTPAVGAPKVEDATKAEQPSAPQIADSAAAVEAPAQPAGIKKPVVPQPADQAASASEQVTPLTPAVGAPKVEDATKAEKPSAPQIADLAAAAAVGAVGAVVALVTDSADPVEKPSSEEAPVTSQETPAPTAQPVTPQTTEPVPGSPQVPDTPALIIQPATPQSTGPNTPGIEPIIPPATTPQPETPKPAEPSPSQTAQPPTPQTEAPTKPAEAARSPENSSELTAAAPQSPSALSKANEALEAFGKHFVSGPVTLKSVVSEPVAKEPEPSDGHSKASEALEAFGKVFVSGPVTLKSEVEEAKTPSEAETDAVHRVFQPKPEEEPIYSNIEELEEIKCTREEDRRKDKPQSSKLTEQILKAIPPEMRKPFTDPDVGEEVLQLLSKVGEQTTSILLDKPVAEDAPEEDDGSGPSAPPVPPRRNRSKGRDAPLPPPKKKGKNGKD